MVWKYKCGHSSTAIVIDSSPLSISAYLEWTETNGLDGDMSLCWDCWNEQRRHEEMIRNL